MSSSADENKKTKSNGHGAVAENLAEAGGEGHRAKHKTTLLGSDFTQQMRELLERDRLLLEESARSNGQTEDFVPAASLVKRYAQDPVGMVRTGSDKVLALTTPIASHRASYSSDHSVEHSQPAGDLVGFLVSYDHGPKGESYDLRVGRWVVSSVPLTSAVSSIVINDETISALHATLKIGTDGSIQILDQFSEHGTTVKRDQKDDSVSIQSDHLNHGDQVTFGKRSFQICIVPGRKAVSKE